MTKEFKSRSVMKLTDRGNLFEVRGKPGDYEMTPEELIGQSVVIDGIECTVRAVERYSIALPYPFSLSFGLLV